MPFQADCPFCPAKFRLPERLVAASVRCPNCGSYFTAAQVDDEAPDRGHHLLGSIQAASAPRKSPTDSLAAEPSDTASRPAQAMPASISDSASHGAKRVPGLRLFLLAVAFTGAVLLTGQLWPRLTRGPEPAKFVMEEPDPNQFLLVTLDNRQLINDLGRTAWANADKESLRQGGVHIRIAWAKIGTPPLKKGAAPANLPKSLLIQVQVANTGGMPIQYRGLAKGSPAPILSSAGAGSWPLRTFAPQTGIVDQIDRAVVAAGKRVQELLVFELLAGEAESLKLEFPAAAFGGRGSCRFRIPRSMIVAAAASKSN